MNVYELIAKLQELTDKSLDIDIGMDGYFGSIKSIIDCGQGRGFLISDEEPQVAFPTALEKKPYWTPTVEDWRTPD